MSPTPEVALELTLSESAKLAGIGYRWLYEHCSPRVDKCFEDLMESESGSDRVKSVYYFYCNKKREDLGKL